LLTAWSTAGILGPVIVNYMHDIRLEAGVPFAEIYAPIFYVLAGMLVVGFFANLMVKPVEAKFFMTEAELSLEKKLAHEKSISAKEVSGTAEKTPLLTILAWLAVGVPIAYGVISTVQKAWVLFN